ncbi:hypothetical protein [Amycolatopsis sp. WAC 04169]|uniref:hypothetical protein n=1 Tax=Amycolatopsis sp. WAC 04169 TaxID=2203197 RepID=UPI001315911A|nr:hypothetical protein [Amycolatopsis sp. WAC 04169]
MSRVVVVVAGVCVVVVFTEPVVVGDVVVDGVVGVAGDTTWPRPAPPPEHAPSSATTPTTSPHNHTRMSRTLTARRPGIRRNG